MAIRSLTYRVLFLAALIGLFSGFVQAPAAAAQTLVISDDNPQVEALGGVRLRNFERTTQGAFLGIPDLGDGSRRVEANINWATLNTLSWRLDRLNDRLLLDLDNENGSWSLSYPNWSGQVSALGSGNFQARDLNSLVLTVLNRDGNPSALMTLDQIALDGKALGSLTAAPGQTPAFTRGRVEGACFGGTDGFELTATLQLDSITATSAELNRVSLSLGVDPDQGLNCAEPAVLSATPSASPLKLIAGQSASVSVQVNNGGSGPARATVVDLAVPSIEDLSVATPASSCTGGQIPCPLGDLTAASSVVLEVEIDTSVYTPEGSYPLTLTMETASVNAGQSQIVIDLVIEPAVDAVFSDRFSAQ